MKAVLIAAGEGSRLRPFSDHKNPKIMLPFLGKPILGYQVEEFLRAGISRFVVICNPLNLSKIKNLEILIDDAWEFLSKKGNGQFDLILVDLYKTKAIYFFVLSLK